MAANEPEAPSPSPARLWWAAEQAHPNDYEARTLLYLDLMRQAGHIIPREEGDDRPLFPCGYEPRVDRDDRDGAGSEGGEEHG